LCIADVLIKIINLKQKVKKEFLFEKYPVTLINNNFSKNENENRFISKRIGKFNNQDAKITIKIFNVVFSSEIQK
jgi:hypothetical protein